MKILGNKRGHNFYFIAAFFLVWIFSICKYPTLSYKAEIWAELGTNYLMNAMNYSFYQNMFTVDAGYLVWLPRLIAWLTYKIFPVYYFPYITNIVSLAFISFSLTFVNHRDFRKIIYSDQVRFTLSLLLGFFIVPHYENYTFTNFSYHGIFLCFLMLFINKDQLKVFEYILFSVLVALLCISKFHFLLFLPIYLLFVLLTIKEKNYKEAYFFIPAVITMMIQITNVIHIIKSDMFIQNSTAAPKSFITILERVSQGIFWYIQSFLPYAPPFLGVLILGIMILKFYQLWKTDKINNRVVLFVLVANCIAIGFAMISCLAALGNREMLLSGNKITLNRLDFITFDFVFLSLFILGHHLYLNHKGKKKIIALLLVVYIIACMGMGFGKSRDKFREGYPFSTSWKEFHQLLNYPDFFIPINPELSLSQWAIRKNCDNLLMIENVNGNIIDTHSIMAENKQVRAIYLQYPNKELLMALAYDKENNIIGEGVMLSSKLKEKKYILFKEKVSPSYIRIVSKEKGDIVFGESNPILIVGQ